jgi:hypothetical protein
VARGQSEPDRRLAARELEQLNLDLRMTAPNPEQSTLGCQSIGEAYAGIM